MKHLLSFIVLVAVILCGCTRTIYQPVETVRTDSISTTAQFNEAQYQYLLNALKHQVNTRDSVVIRDSVVMVVNEAGGVVSKEVFRDRDRNHSRDEAITQIQAKYDSIFNAQREEFNAVLDQIQQIPIPVEKPLSKWEQLKQEIGGIAIGILVAILSIAVVWLIRKIKHQQ